MSSPSVDSPIDTFEFREPDDEPTRVIQAFGDGFFFAERFRIDDVLGTGGMGTVYAAVDIPTDTTVALKVLHKKGGEGEERFRREAEILASMHHPGIVGIHGFGAAEDGQLWLAMEHLTGETLRERVQRQGPLDPAELCPIVTATCAALAAAHERGVIHRDLKPDNIFLAETSEGQTPQPKLLDFGLSLAVTSKKLTKTGTMIGTPRYMAPEQIKSAHEATGPADIYALGIICYEALTGQSPFVASDHGQLLGAIMMGKTQPLSNVMPDLPEALSTCLLKAMAPDVADRYASPEEFSLAFADAAAIHVALRHTPAPPAVRGKPTLVMNEPPSGVRREVAAALERDSRPDATVQTGPPRFSVPEGLPVARPDKPAKRSVPTWMIPVAVLIGAGIMGVGAWIAYMFIK